MRTTVGMHCRVGLKLIWGHFMRKTLSVCVGYLLVLQIAYSQWMSPTAIISAVPKITLSGTQTFVSAIFDNLFANDPHNGALGTGGSAGFFLFTSQDGISFQPNTVTMSYNISQDGLYPTLRDSNIVKANGTYYVTFTVNYDWTYPHTFGMVKSTDLVHWTNVPTPDLTAQLADATGATMIWSQGLQQINGGYYVIVATAFEPSVNYAVPFDPITNLFGMPIKITGSFPTNKFVIWNIFQLPGSNTYYTTGQNYSGTYDGYILTSVSPFSGYAGGTRIINATGGEVHAMVRDITGKLWLNNGKIRVVADEVNGHDVYVESSDMTTWSTPTIIGPPYPFTTYTLSTAAAAINSVSSTLSPVNYTIIAVNDFQTQNLLAAVSAGVTANPSFSNWDAYYFSTQQLNDPTVSGATAVPQHDGVSNLLKYFFDINPAATMQSSDFAALPVVGTANQGGINYLTMTYRRNVAATGITSKIQTSTDLQNWTDTASDFTQTVKIDLATGDPIIQVGIKMLTGQPKLFVRLKVTLN